MQCSQARRSAQRQRASEEASIHSDLKLNIQSHRVVYNEACRDESQNPEP